MPDYQKSKIYKLYSPLKNLVYIGSTTQAISQRLAEHISRKKNKTYDCASYLVLECEDYKIEILEEYPCNNKQQLLKKEGEYIRNNECVNRNISGQTRKEYWNTYYKNNQEHLKEYKKNNQEHIKQHRQKYYEDNKEEILEKMKINSANHYEKNKEQILLYQKNCREIKKQNNAIYKWLLMTGIVQ